MWQDVWRVFSRPRVWGDDPKLYSSALSIHYFHYFKVQRQHLCRHGQQVWNEVWWVLSITRVWWDSPSFYYPPLPIDNLLTITKREREREGDRGWLATTPRFFAVGWLLCNVYLSTGYSLCTEILRVIENFFFYSVLTYATGHGESLAG